MFFILLSFLALTAHSYLWNMDCPWCSGLPMISQSPSYIMTYPSYQQPSHTIVISSSPVYRPNVDYRLMQQPSYNLRTAAATASSSLSHQTQYYGNNQQIYYQQPSRSPYQMSYQELSKRYPSASGYNPNSQQYHTIPDVEQSNQNDYESDSIAKAPYAKSRTTIYGRAQKELLEQMSKKRLNHHETGSNSMSTVSEGQTAINRNSAEKPPSTELPQETEDFEIDKERSTISPQGHSKKKIEDALDFDYPEKGGKEPEVMQAASLDGHIQKDDNISNEFVPIEKDKEPSEKLEESKIDPNLLEKIKKKLKENEQM